MQFSPQSPYLVLALGLRSSRGLTRIFPWFLERFPRGQGIVMSFPLPSVFLFEYQAESFILSHENARPTHKRHLDKDFLFDLFTPAGL